MGRSYSISVDDIAAERKRVDQQIAAIRNVLVLDLLFGVGVPAPRFPPWQIGKI